MEFDPMESIGYKLQEILDRTNAINDKLNKYDNQVKELAEQVSKGEYSDVMKKVDAMGETMNELKQDVERRTQLRLERIDKMEWKRLLENENWIPMEQPRQLSSEYFEHPDIKSVILLYQLDDGARQDIIKEFSYAEKMQNGSPDKFYLGIVNGHKELILSEEFFDHELFYVSRNATNEYEISCSTLKEIAGHIYDYEDVISLTVDEKHLNHEPRQMVNDTGSSWNAAIEEVMEAAELAEPDFEMEM